MLESHSYRQLRFSDSRYCDQKDKPVLRLGLQSEVHPSLAAEARNLEYAAKRLQYVVEFALQKHGKDIIEQQMLLERIADIVIDIFAQTAVLGRASRAHRVSVESAAHETNLAQAFCYDSSNRIKQNVEEVLKGNSNNSDRYRKIATTMFEKDDYGATHPILKGLSP